MTDRNCRKLVEDREVIAVLNWNGSVLLVWSTGEVYAALGYRIGSDGEGCRLLAAFLAEFSEGRWASEADLIEDLLAKQPLDWNGPVDLPK